MDHHRRRTRRALSPYPRAHIARFEAHATDELGLEPEAFNPALAEVGLDVDLAA
ncbi:hypothetical protein [Nonomuraea sp. NPDC052265]|uniref:hypothetical protein n=1 Tax=Nonomuraea sp. NPDC052265 TaxID=3364374 RepID=UPI0037C66105